MCSAVPVTLTVTVAPSMRLSNELVRKSSPMSIESMRGSDDGRRAGRRREVSPVSPRDGGEIAAMGALLGVARRTTCCRF